VKVSVENISILQFATTAQNTIVHVIWRERSCVLICNPSTCSSISRLLRVKLGSVFVQFHMVELAGTEAPKEVIAYSPLWLFGCHMVAV
jgi:hypothetical protein